MADPDARHSGHIHSRQGPDHHIRLVDSFQQFFANQCGPSGRSVHGQAGGANYVITGSVFEPGQSGTVKGFGTRVQEPAAFKVGEQADLGEGETHTVNSDGSYVYTKNAPFEGSRGKRVYLTVTTPPAFTMDNYRTVLLSEGIGRPSSIR